MTRRGIPLLRSISWPTRALALLIIFDLAVFFLLPVQLLYVGQPGPVRYPVDAAAILFHDFNTTRTGISNETKRRLHYGISLLQSKKAGTLLVAGGNRPDPGINGAGLMAEYVRSLGIPDHGCSCRGFVARQPVKPGTYQPDHAATRTAVGRPCQLALSPAAAKDVIHRGAWPDAICPLRYLQLFPASYQERYLAFRPLQRGRLYCRGSAAEGKLPRGCPMGSPPYRILTRGTSGTQGHGARTETRQVFRVFQNPAAENPIRRAAMAMHTAMIIRKLSTETLRLQFAPM